MTLAGSSRCGPAAALALAALLTGCSVNTPPRLLASQPGAPLPAQVRIDAPASPEAQRFAATLAGALEARGITSAPNADTVIAVALSQQPAAMGIAQEGAEVRWLSPPRRQHLLDRCSAQRLQVIVVAKSATAAQPLYTGRGAFDFCTLAPESLDRLAMAFAGAMPGK